MANALSSLSNDFDRGIFKNGTSVDRGIFGSPTDDIFAPFTLASNRVFDGTIIPSKSEEKEWTGNFYPEDKRVRTKRPGGTKSIDLVPIFAAGIPIHFWVRFPTISEKLNRVGNLASFPRNDIADNEENNPAIFIAEFENILESTESFRITLEPTGSTNGDFAFVPLESRVETRLISEPTPTSGLLALGVLGLFSFLKGKRE